MRRVLTRSRSLVAAAGVLATLAATATTLPVSSAAAAPPAAAAPRAAAAAAAGITWGECPTATLQRFNAECGSVSVPLDYSNPGGAKASIAVSRVKATAAPYKGPILVNPGGPGGSGLVYSIFQTFVNDGAGLNYDWIGFDPRGVGRSTPSLSCQPDFFQGPRPAYEPEGGQEQANITRSKQYAAACAANNNATLLNNMKTTDVARDMDEIRKALGAPTMSYLGFSYGTYLGQVYTELFPGRTDKVIMDGVVDPRHVFEQSNLDQDAAFERNIGLWFDWLAKYDSVYHLGTTRQQVSDLYYATKDKLAANPAGGTIGSAEFADIILYAGYYDSVWFTIADAFVAAVNGDAQTLVDTYADFVGPGDDNGFAVYLAVQCTDAPWSSTYQAFRASQVRTARQSPFLTWGNAWFNAPCVFWPAPAGKPTTITGKGASSALLISQTNDAATPYPGAVEVRRLFKGASLVAEPGGTTHSGSFSGNECTDGAIADYLRDGTLPTRRPGTGADRLCTPLPHPDPTSASGYEAGPPPVAPLKTKGASAYKVRGGPSVAQ